VFPEFPRLLPRIPQRYSQHSPTWPPRVRDPKSRKLSPAWRPAYAAKKGWRFVVAEALHAAHGDIDTEYRKLGANLLQELEALRKKGG
jgi:hypothetical protein